MTISYNYIIKNVCKKCTYDINIYLKPLWPMMLRLAHRPPRWFPRFSNSPHVVSLEVSLSKSHGAAAKIGPRCKVTSFPKLSAFWRSVEKNTSRSKTSPSTTILLFSKLFPPRKKIYANSSQMCEICAFSPKKPSQKAEMLHIYQCLAIRTFDSKQESVSRDVCWQKRWNR